ncbi:hypothetical protein, partial [Rhodopseudomonas palustris]|uniref:hypothetical protein n=1 Tax=Rhodopseudomonas palustris TaxID=1076 RepID=UPI001AEC07FF
KKPPKSRLISSLRAEDGASRRPTAKQSSDIKQGRDCFVATAPRYDGLEGVVLLVAFSTRL